MRLYSKLVPAAVVAIVACQSVGNGESVDRVGANVVDGSRLPCDVDAVLDRSCRRCHGSPPLFGAPMPLVTHDDLHAAAHSDRSRKVYELVASRVHDNDRPMPPRPNPRLTPAELALLDGWIANGAPASTGGGSCAGDGGTTEHPLSCTPDVHLTPAAAWAMPETTDDIYVCYGFDATNEGKRHVVGIAPKIDNPAIVHHLLLLQTEQAVSPIPAPCSSAPMRARIVYGWAPGGKHFEFPPEAGYPQDKTTHYMMQVHYNNVLHRPNQKDASGFDFCTTDKLRPNDADTMAFGSVRFQIPPRATTDLTCATKMPAGIPPLHLFAAFPHMHQLGTTIATTKPASEGSPAQDLGAQTSWDFQNQAYLPIEGSIAGGDTVQTRCAWKNTGDTVVNPGERTVDEMCFSFTMYYPRIADPNWNPFTPSAISRCTPTPTPTL